MMRRQSVSAAVACGRSVSAYGIAGHPDMATDMTLPNHFPARKEAVAGPVRVSKLPNGVRVVTQSLDSPHVAFGAYIEAGAKFDPATAPGMSYVMRWAMSGSNMDNSLYQLDRNARAVGAAREHCEVRKRFIGLKFEAMAGEHWTGLAQDILTSVSAPRLPEYDIERFRDTMDNLRDELRWNYPREYAVDELETVAFYREALGNPRMVPPALQGASSHATLLQQWAALCVPSRVVIAGVNVDHDAVLAVYENAPFQHSAEAPHHAKAARPNLPTATEKSQYIPGGDRMEIENRSKAMGTKPDQDPEAVVALGFQAHGMDANVNGFAASLVARELAATAFGESLALNQDAPHHGVESFYRPFADTGLLGATIRCAPSDTQPLVMESAKVLRSLPNAKEAIEAAKARAKVRFYKDNLEVARDYVDFLGASLIGDTIQRNTAEHVFDAIAAVDAAAVKGVVDGFKQISPCYFATGTVQGLPSCRQLGL